MNRADVVAAIITGQLDEDRDAIVDAIRARDAILRKQKQAVAVATLKLGQQVAITGEIRPKALMGITGTLISLRASRVDIQLDELNARLAGRYVRADRVLRGIPASVVEAV
jgi:hypothetical protein